MNKKNANKSARVASYSTVYTCQKQQPDRCGFFLWDEEAEPRMESAVLNNSTSEVLIPPRPAISSNLPAPRETEQRLQITAQTRTPVTTPKKRKLPWLDYDTEDSDAEVYPWQLTGEEELALSQATDAAVADSRDKLGSRKAVKHDDFSRPGGASTTNIVSLMANGLVTPGTTPQKMVIKREVVEPETPTPLRFSDVAIKREMSSEERSLAPSRSSETPGASDKNGGGNLTAQVFGILRSAGVELRADSAGPLKAVLERHVLRQLGAERGREMVRAGLKSREATIVHQAQRIMALETELEACKALVKCLRGG